MSVLARKIAEACCILPLQGPTPVSYTHLDAKVVTLREEAIALLADGMATQDEVDALVDALETAVKNASKPSSGGSSGGHKGGGSSNGGGSYAGEGTVAAVVTPATPVVPAAKSVISDTTMPFVLKRGNAYCFKMTVVNGLSLIHI